MKFIFTLIIAALVFAGCVSNASETEQAKKKIATQEQNGTENGLKTIKSPEAKTLLLEQSKVVILDVRTPEEFKKGHLQNAILINKNSRDFEDKIMALDKNKTYLVYCAVGGRSGQAARYMESIGFKNIYDATEGFAALKATGVPVE